MGESPTYKLPRSGDMYLEHLSPGTTIDPRTVTNSKPLSSKWSTAKVTRYEYARDGIYMPYGLHNTPHWTQPIHDRKKWTKQITQRTGSPPTVIDVNSGYHRNPNEMVALNCNSPKWKEIAHLHQSYPWLEAARACIYQSPTTCDRGNIARNQGWTDQNADTTTSKKATMPSVLKATAEDSVHRMILATKLLHKFCEIMDINVPFTDDQTRTELFAHQLCERFGIPSQQGENLFEFVTDAVLLLPNHKSGCSINGYKIHDTQQINIHCDSKNDPRWRAVFILYHHEFIPEYNSWSRITSICTVRKCCLDSKLRLFNADSLFAHMVQYGRHGLSNGRGPKTLDDLPTHNDEPTKPHLPIASFDKLGGFHSSAATAVQRMMSKFHKQRPDLEFVLELLLPFTLASTYVNTYAFYHKCYQSGQLPNKTNTGNFALETIAYLVEEHGGINRGKGQRMTTWCNFSLYLRTVMRCLSAMRQAVEDANQCTKPMPYSQLAKSFKAGGTFGDLGAQHGIAVLACVGILKHGPTYLSQAEVCDGTETYKRLHKHYNLRPTSINLTYKRVAEELRINTGMTENIGCEMPKDIDLPQGFNIHTYNHKVTQRLLNKPGSPLRPDCLFPNQFLYKLINMDLFRLWRETKPSGQSVDLQEKVLFIPRQRSRSDPWIYPPSRHTEEIKVSRKSKFRHLRAKRGSKRRKLNPETHMLKEDRADPTYRRTLTPWEKYIQATSRRRATRYGFTFSIDQFYGAIRAKNTLKHIDAISVIVDSFNPKTPRHLRSRSNLVQVSTQETVEGSIGFSAKLMKQVLVHADSPTLLRFGLLGFTNKGHAVYRSKALSIRAAFLHCCIDLPYAKQDTKGGLPAWLYPHATACSDPIDNNVVLYMNCPHFTGNYHVLGVLGLRPGQKEYVLQVPEDSNVAGLCFDDDTKWQFVPMRASHWSQHKLPHIQKKTSLIGSKLQKELQGITYKGKVVEYHILQEQLQQQPQDPCHSHDHEDEDDYTQDDYTQPTQPVYSVQYTNGVCQNMLYDQLESLLI